MMAILSGGFLVAGAFFFMAGTVGLLRFPDIYCRLHALTKADNLGLGLVVLGLGLQPMEWTGRLQLVLTWLVALIAAATVCHILARSSLRRGIEPVTAPSPKGVADPRPEEARPGPEEARPGREDARPGREDARPGREPGPPPPGAPGEGRYGR